MRLYFLLIKQTQEILLAISIVILSSLPVALALQPDWFAENHITYLYAIAHLSLFIVMIVRPLADLLPQLKFVRPLVILRKGMGVLSASIIVSFILAKLIVDPLDYLNGFGNAEYWSLENLTLLAHLADISAILLLVTSNNLSKKVLGKNWKRIQRLSYVYFYGSALYVFFILGDQLMLWYLAIVTLLTGLAFIKNRFKKPVAETTLKPLSI